MSQHTLPTRRSILRSSGKALAATTVGLTALETASADNHYAPGVRVSLDADGDVPCWVGDTGPCNYDSWYQMPSGAEAYCKTTAQSFSCGGGTFVEVNDLDFNVLAWVNTDFLQVVG